MFTSVSVCLEWYLSFTETTFTRRPARLSYVPAASVISVECDLIDTPLQKLGKFCFTWPILDDLYIGPKKTTQNMYGLFPLKSYFAMRTISKSKTFALRFAVKPCGGAQLSWLMLQLSPTCKKSAVGSVISARRSCLHTTYWWLAKWSFGQVWVFGAICFCSCCALDASNMKRETNLCTCWLR